MNRDAWRRIRKLFDRVMERPPEEWSAFLDTACVQEEDLRDLARNLSEVAYVLLVELDRPAEALPKYVAALEMRERLYKGDHRDVAWTLNEVARCLYALGRPAEALRKLETAMAMWKRLRPGGDADIEDTP